MIGRREFLKGLLSSFFVLFSQNCLSYKKKSFALAIDVRRCTAENGCRACIDVCHEIHNVPKIENNRHEIKWIFLAKVREVFPDEHLYGIEEKEIPVLCNHCENPPCVKVCPVKATWLREDGIVMIDYHRCIGCRYCMAACPYGSRSFNFVDPSPFIKKRNRLFPARTKGVVEKCNLCEERIAKNLPPACVEACKERAIIFGDLNDPESEIRKNLRSRAYLLRKSHLGTKPKVFYLF